jgi:hypothetical protein
MNLINTKRGLLHFGGCKDHPDKTNLSCAKIRTQDGTPLTMTEVWELLTETYREQQGNVTTIENRADYSA